VISFFQKKKTIPVNSLTTDMHSHLLAGLDDGVKSLDEALIVIEGFISMGYKKLITTPHIMSDYYRNEPDIIKERLVELNLFLAERSIDVSVHAAAEYYLDEELINKLTNKERLLCLADRFLLFETNFFNEPYQLKEFIFEAITQGYKPVLAHPERYQYMTLEVAEELRDRGVYFQVNIPSLAGAYGKEAYKMASKLIEKGWIEFLGSDCHNPSHLKILEEAFRNKYFVKALELPLINNSL
jgi:tyrosine-protein phosphatase YwqE